MEKTEIKLSDLKICVDWIYKKEDATEQYKEGYLDALYDMAATLGVDEELDEYEDKTQERK